MLTGLLEALQEASGKLMTSGIVARLCGVIFVAMCLISGIAVLVTGMYLADPKGFDDRLSKVLVERPVVAGTEEAAEEEEAQEEEEEGEEVSEEDVEEEE